jgi:hypothetical protein
MTPTHGSLFGQANFGQAQPGYGPALPSGALLVSDLVYTAYRIAGILPEPGRGYSVSEGIDGLKRLNSFLNAMQAERLMVYAYLRQTYVITPNKKTYSIGSTVVNGVPPDWLAIQRPESITLAGYVFTSDNPSVECPMQILTYQDYAALSPKDLSSSISYILYYQPDVPNGTVFLWPVPTDPSVQIALYLWQSIQTVASLTTAMVLPPAYQEFLEYGLAIRLAGTFPRRARLDPEAKFMFDQARTKVMSANEPMLKMQCETGAGSVKQSVGRFNIISGTNVGGVGWSG